MAPECSPVNLWFDYPIHRSDESGALGDIQPDAEKPPWQRAMASRKPKEQKAQERKKAVAAAYEACGINEKVTVQDLAEYLGVSEKTVRRRLKEHGGYDIEDSEVRKKT